MDKIKIALCDDEEFLCKGYESFFEYEDDMEFMGYCTKSADCVKLIEDTNPDIFLLDIQLENDCSGIDILPELTERFPDLKIIMLTSYDYNNYIFSALTNNAVNYVLKNTDNTELFAAIRDAYHDKIKLSREVSDKLISQSKKIMNCKSSILYMINLMATLSSSEVQFLLDLCDGKSYKQIANERFVEPNTVRKTSSRILQKLGTNDINKVVELLNGITNLENLDK